MKRVKEMKWEEGEGWKYERHVSFGRVSVFHCFSDHLCGLVVRVPGYRSRSPGSTPGATRFSEK
jgi:hypothetical protein